MAFDEVRRNDAVRVEQEEDVGVGVSCAQIPGPTGAESVVRLEVVANVEAIDRLDHAANVLIGPVVAYVNLEGRRVRLLRQRCQRPGEERRPVVGRDDHGHPKPGCPDRIGGNLVYVVWLDSLVHSATTS